MFFDYQSLLDWFSSQKRDFPWRNHPSPYEVWVSEVMLQQTRASVVIPYFLRWMKKYPTIASLAQANLDEVIKLWEGLGYYQRARNLYWGANQVMEEFGGELPSSIEQLKKIRGLGPYTIGAIRAFGFKKKSAAVDGNVKRVITRLFQIEDDLSKASSQKKIWEKAEYLIQESPSIAITESLIELGALVCLPKPQCQLCPLQNSCKALLHGQPELLPFQSKKMVYESIERMVFVIECDRHLLLKKETENRIMKDLYEFPYIPRKNSCSEDLLKNHFGMKAVQKKRFQPVKHTFTKYRARLEPFYMEANEFYDLKNYRWYSQEELDRIPFSSGHKKVYLQWKKEKEFYI